MKVSRQLMIYLAEHLANGYYSDRYTSITTAQCVHWAVRYSRVQKLKSENHFPMGKNYF